MKTFTKNPLPNLAQIRFPRPRGNCLYVHWCCICSKCAEQDKGNATSTSKSCFIFSCCNPLKGLFTSRKDEPAAVATTMVGSDSGEGVLDAKLKGYGAVSSGMSSLDNREKNRMKKLGLSFDLRRKWNGHHRRATMDGRVKDIRNGTVDGGHGNEVDTSGVGVGEGTNSEHAATGWPGWLTNVAPEAVQGWFPRRADSFEKLDKIGEGTYSTVYKARDLKSGSVVALKKVRFVNMDPDSVRFMAREIHILRRLDHPNVVKLEGIVISCVSHNIYLVFEYMEHDLAGLAATPGLKFTEPQVKCFMQQLLDGLDHCHKNGVLHRDIKGSNLLIDSNGILKIADFGLATSFGADDQQPLTSRVVTLWYRPPELLLGATDYGVAVDMWSTGCILAELLVGKPIMPGRTEVEQIHKIFKLCGSPSDEYWTKAKVPPTTMFRPQHRYRRCVAETFRGFPRSALALLDDLLALEPEARGTAASALQSDFFRTKPLACSPSSLPKFPPSKEYDVRLRQEDARRKRKEAQRSESVRPGNENPTTHHAANGVTEVKKHGHKRSKSNSLQLSPEDSVLGFHLEAPTLQPPGYESTWNNNTASHDNGHHMVPGRTYNSVRVSNGHALRVHTSLVPQHGAAAAAGSRNARHNRSGTVDRPGFHKEDGVKKPKAMEVRTGG